MIDYNIIQNYYYADTSPALKYDRYSPQRSKILKFKKLAPFWVPLLKPKLTVANVHSLLHENSVNLDLTTKTFNASSSALL